MPVDIGAAVVSTTRHRIRDGLVFVCAPRNATVREVLFPKDNKRASGGMIATQRCRCVAFRKRNRMHAQVLQGTLESLKKAEKETQHLGVSVLAFVMLHNIFQLAKYVLLVGIPLESVT